MKLTKISKSDFAGLLSIHQMLDFKIIFLSVISKNDRMEVKNIGIIHATKLNITITTGNHSKRKGLVRIITIEGFSCNVESARLMAEALLELSGIKYHHNTSIYFQTV